MRKLVTVRKVDKILPIPKADFIELCIVGGWSCITKKGEFQTGDKGLFFEIDSWIPATDTRFEFLGKTKSYNDREGWRIRTMKMRKVLSQGLLLPLTSFPELDFTLKNVDYAEALNVEKWEITQAEQTAMKAGNPKGRFPAFIRKTDQERLQNLAHYFEIHKDTEFEETKKLDGSSITMFNVADALPWYRLLVNKFMPNTFKAERFGVCSRNLELKEGESDFWRAAIRHNMHRDVPVGYAVQGELLGPKIQNNHEKVQDLEIHVYDIFNISEQRYCTTAERFTLMANHMPHVKHVPVIDHGIKIFQHCENFDEFQKRVTGISINPGTVSEGRVYKAMDGSFSFKLISNEYLLREK